MTAAVELTEVSRSFAKAAVLREISLRTESGQAVAVYGRSGSGKTTLLNIVGGLDRPNRGRVQVGGVDLSTLSDDALTELRRTRMGFIFQSYGLLSHLTALENVEFALRLAGCSRAQWRERATEALDAVGLAGRARHRPGELSGGERQRVAVARVLAVRPSIVLADEPTGALDHATGVIIADLLTAYARQAGASVWIATHDQSVADRVDRIYRIIDGRLRPEEGSNA
jgi:putative ABC transport system ATP-binding protein